MEILSGVLLPLVTVNHGTLGLAVAENEICWVMTVDWTPLVWPEGTDSAPVVRLKDAVPADRIKSAETWRMVRPKPVLAAVPEASVTVTPGLKSPATVGVPEMEPLESRVTPAGRLPPESVHL